MTQGVKTGIVLSGGGARGAYEVGLLAGMVEVLGLKPGDPPPFQIYTGSSVGAINVSFLAAHAHRGDMGTEALAEVWSGLNLAAHLRVDFFGLMGLRGVLRGRVGRREGRALLDPSGLERVVVDRIPWGTLHDNVQSGCVDSLTVASLRVHDGQTTLFTELAPHASFRPSRDPRRTVVEGPIRANTVLASAAIPMIFPLRKVGGHWYCDGGLRSNTPIAPAIRAGADRLVIVSLLHDNQDPVPPPKDTPYPSPVLLLGKVLNALLLDPIAYDLQVLKRLNRLLDVMDEALDVEARQRVDDVTVEARGMPYRHIRSLVFSPSEDLGAVAGHHLRESKIHEQLGRVGSWFMRRAAKETATWELDLASYVLFDGAYARRLIDIGRRDAHTRSDEIVEFFK